jgi:hypothetical protein
MSQAENYQRWRHKHPCPICGGPKDAKAEFCRKCFLVAQGPDGDPLSEQKRFWEKVDKNGPIIKPELGPCWIWKGTCDKLGYGRFGIKRSGSWIKVLAHRYSYELLVGKIPEGVEPDHLCRNPACVNPSHLETVTHQENLRRGEHANGQSTKTHCPKGHPYNEENTYVDKRGGRTCRICHKESERQWELNKLRKEV